MNLYCQIFILICIALNQDVRSIHLTESDLNRVVWESNMNNVHKRFIRQAINDPQMFPVLNAVLNVPLPTNIGFFPGGSKPLDVCNRDEIQMEDGTCQNLLTQGNCAENEEVLLDPETNKGFCAPRLCPPGRVFVHSTQLCHDPTEMGICPPGRELYYSSYGTSVCSCPDGTVEGDDDLDDDVCEPILEKSLQCLPDQVFWFKDFNSPPQCLPDPCNGLNLKKSPTELPYVPSKDTGVCQQIGQSEPVCPKNMFFALSMESLSGECVTLEDAGYNVFENDTFARLKEMFGSKFIARSGSPVSPTNSGATIQPNINSPQGQQTPSNQQNLQISSNQQIQSNQPISSNQQNQQNQQISNNQLNLQTTSNQQISSSPQNQPFISNQQISQNNPLVDSSISSNPQSIINPSNQNQQQTDIRNNLGSSNNFQDFSSNRHFQNINNQHQNLNQQSGSNNQRISNNRIPFDNNVNGRHRLSSQSQGNQVISSQNQQISSQTNLMDNQGSVTRLNNQVPFKFLFFDNLSNKQNNLNQQKSRPNQHKVTQKKKFINQHQTKSVSLSTQRNQQNRIVQPNHQQHGGNQQNQNQRQRQPQFTQQIHQSNPQRLNSNHPGTQTFHQEPISIEIFGNGNSAGGHQSVENFGPGGQFNSPEVFGSNSHGNVQSIEIFSNNAQNFGSRLIRSLGFKNPPKFGLLAAHITVLPSGNIIEHFVPKNAKNKSTFRDEYRTKEDHPKILSRKKRTLFGYASPSNVYETRLLGCRPGAARDINGKCRNTILPARLPKRRGTRAAPPVAPTPSCPSGMAFNIRRQCVPSSKAQNALIAYNLG